MCTSKNLNSDLRGGGVESTQGLTPNARQYSTVEDKKNQMLKNSRG